MRIALTITELDVGGAEKCLTQLALWLLQNGHTVEVFAIGPPPPDGQDSFPNQLAAAKIPVHFGGYSGTHRALPALWWLRKKLHDFSPEIVQSMLFHANVLTACAISKDAKFFGGARVKQPERLRQRLQGWAVRKMEKLICVSEDIAQSSSELERIAPDKLYVIPNGVEVTNSEPGDWRELGIPAGSRVILSIGRLAEQKGYQELIQRADEILLEHPTHHIVIFGQGPLESQLQRLTATAQASSRIHFAGWKAHVTKWLAACETFVLPTHYEGMPNVLLEAMAAGRPVVVNDVEGIREVLGSDGAAQPQIARQLRDDNGKNFAELTKRMITSEPLRQECGQANLLRVKQHFCPEDQFQKYLDLYRAALDD